MLWRIFEKILAAGIHTYLQVYMAFRGIPFEMFEDGSGALSRPWILADIHRKSSPARYELIEKYRLYDHQNSMITKKYCDMKAQEQGFYDKKAEDFQVMEHFHSLTDQKKDDIRHIFTLPFQKGREDRVLLLTQQFANLGQLPYDGQICIYHHLFAYYLRDRKVIIKTHPDDILYYHRLFPEAEVIRETFPSELLPLVFEKMPDSVCTVSSTGVNQIRENLRSILFSDLPMRQVMCMTESIMQPYGWRTIWAYTIYVHQESMRFSFITWQSFVRNFRGNFQ